MSALRNLRKAGGVTQRELAEKVGLTQAAIGHYETGRRHPGLSEARKLVAALNDMGILCTLEEAFPPDDTKTAA
ncbi:helix-turn-helix protein [compost metagenome]